jgi:hypothetical protein
MRGIVVVTLLGLAALGSASSSYVAYSKAMEGRVDLCGVSPESEGDGELPAMFRKAILRQRSK